MSLVVRLFVCLQVFSVLTVYAGYNRNRYQVCSKFLSMRIDRVCKGRPYNTLTPGGKKRADPMISSVQEYFQGTILESPDQLNYNEETDNIEDRMTGLSQYQQFQRVRRGIVEECCHKPCSDATILEYCS